ncbi:MAG TPA: ABC transporter substrate-binding protein [Candidatus Binatia bacterium]
MTNVERFCSAHLVFALFWLVAGSAAGQNRPVKVAYSAISAGIGGLWLTHEQGIFKKHGLDSSLIYFRSGTTAAQALLAGEIDFGHLAPGPMMAAWAQGADFVWIGTTVHKMVFTLVAEPAIMRGESLKGKKIGITRIGSAADLAVRAALEHFGLTSKDVSLISMGGIPDILTGLRAGAVQAAILSPPFSTAALDLGYRRLLFIPDLGKEFTFSGIAAQRGYVNANPNVARAFMTALTEGAKIYAENSKAALVVLKRYAKVEKDSILEAGYREYASALTSPPYPSLKGLEAVRESFAESAPALKNADLKKFIDDRFVKAR